MLREVSSCLQVCLCALPAIFLTPSAFAQADRVVTLLIRGVTVVSPERDAPYGPVDVSIADGRIAAIGASLPADGLQSDQVVDGAGRFLMPGLIDSHVHLSTIPGMHDGHETQFPEIAEEARKHIPLSYLYHGFTSVVDLISNSKFAERWNAREIRPHAYYCGGAPIMDGYPTQFIPKPVRHRAHPNFLYDPSRPDEFPKELDPAEHTPAAVVARIASDGAVGIKAFWEDGFGNARNIPVPPKDVLVELVAASHAKNLPVILHANSENAQAAGVDGGVDAFAHGLWTWDSPDAPELTEPIKAVLDTIIERGIAWQPTIQVLYGERDLFDPGFLSRPDVRAAVPQAVLDWYATKDGQWLTDEMRDMSPQVVTLESEGRWREIDALPIRHVTQALAYLYTNGGRLLFGTDTPSAPTYANPAGLNGRLEMDRWIQAGVAPKDIVRAATLANAEFFNLDEDIGTVEVGKRADLLLLERNPYETVDAFDTINLVILEGRHLDRTELAANADTKETRP